MVAISKEQFPSLQLEIFNIEGKVFQDCSNVVLGYIFHFTIGKELHLDSIKDLSTNGHWKYEFNDSLENLKKKLNKLKKELLFNSSKLLNEFDQFAYINLFIVQIDSQYKLLVTSDIFDVSKIILLS